MITSAAHPQRRSAATARTFLFVPGNRPERFDKAARSGADAVILDLEDSVPPLERKAARRAIEGQWPALQSQQIPLVVRINPLSSDDAEEDLALLKSLALPFSVMVPKAESGETLNGVHMHLQGVGMLPIIETAKGWAALSAIAGAPGTIRLVAGYVDFMADTGLHCDEVDTELATLKFAICMATRLNDLPQAIDGVTVQLHDDHKLESDVRRAIRFGFGGKLCLHPRQVNIVHQAMRPTADEIAWARKVVSADAATEGRAMQLEGRMVDLPVVKQALRTLARL